MTLLFREAPGPALFWVLRVLTLVSRGTPPPSMLKGLSMPGRPLHSLACPPSLQAHGLVVRGYWPEVGGFPQVGPPGRPTFPPSCWAKS